MPSYIYACKENKKHPRKEVTHGMKEDPVIICDECGSKMSRVPQSFRFYMSPFEILADWSDENWRRHKARKKRGSRTPRFSPDKINRPVPLGGKDFEKR